jgi:hypothetical protein
MPSLPIPAAFLLGVVLAAPSPAAADEVSDLIGRARAQQAEQTQENAKIPVRLDCSPDAPGRVRSTRKGLDINPGTSGLSPETIRCLAPSWYYTWSSDPNPFMDAAKVPFVPMVRGTGQDQNCPARCRAEMGPGCPADKCQFEVEKDIGLMKRTSTPPDTILLFNEPDLQRWSFQHRDAHDGRYGPPQTTVAGDRGAAASFLKIRKAFPNAKFGLPKMAGAGDLNKSDPRQSDQCLHPESFDASHADGPFESYVARNGRQAVCKDFVDSMQWLPQFERMVGDKPFAYSMMQWYGDADPKAFENAVTARWKAYGLPVIITEFAVSDSKDVNNTDYRLSGVNKYDSQLDTVEHFMRCALTWMEKGEGSGYVKGYAWMAPDPSSFEQKGPGGLEIPSAMISIRPSRLWDDHYQLTRLGAIYAQGGTLLPNEKCP